MSVVERQITETDPDYDNVTRILKDIGIARRVPKDRAWMVTGDTRTHLEVETFVTDAEGTPLLVCELEDGFVHKHTQQCKGHTEAAVYPERTTIWID